MGLSCNETSTTQIFGFKDDSFFNILLPRGLLKTFEWNNSPTSFACFTEELPEPIPEANLKNAELKKIHHKWGQKSWMVLLLDFHQDTSH